MDEATVQLPVKCMECQSTSLVDFPVLVVITALTRWHTMQLYVNCHSVEWDASVAELDAIRRYLGREWIEAYRSPDCSTPRPSPAGTLHGEIADGGAALKRQGRTS